MRAPTHGVRHVPLLRPHLDQRCVVRDRVRSHRIAGLWLAMLLVAGLCGCNTMNGQLNNQVGMWNYRQGNYVAAREEFMRATADDPQNPSFAYNLASAMKKQGDVVTAEQTYIRALHNDPSHQPSYHGLAELMNEQGRRAEAMQLVSSWAEARPRDAGAQIELAWIQRENGDLNAAEQSLHRALAAHPNDSIATAQLGQIYQETGQTDRASAMYRRSLQADWLQPQVQSRLASLRGPNSFSASPPTMFAANFGTSSTAAIPFPANPPYVQAPPGTQTALLPSPGNDDPAHSRD
jgi:Tfp pilus assembly protein PilF